jgi:hypothetical protein
VLVTRAGSAALLAATLQLVGDPAPSLSAYSAYAAGRAAAVLHAQLTALVAASESAAYFLTSPKLKRCVQGVATARKPPDLGGASLLGWPLLGGLQPGAAASAVWDLADCRARSLAAFYLRAYAQSRTPDSGRLWCGSPHGHLPSQLASFLHRGGGDGVAGRGPTSLPLLSTVHRCAVLDEAAWCFPQPPPLATLRSPDALLAGLRGSEGEEPFQQRPALPGTVRERGRLSTFEEKLLGLEDEKEARSRVTWSRLVVVGTPVGE